MQSFACTENVFVDVDLKPSRKGGQGWSIVINVRVREAIFKFTAKDMRNGSISTV